MFSQVVPARAMVGACEKWEKIMPAAPWKLEPGEQRQLAATIFNHVWGLLIKPDRSASDDDEMLHGAHASR
jgi:hypothetical protein